VEGRRRLAAWLEAAKALQPENPEVHILRSRFLAGEPGGSEAALEAGRRALELDPENPRLWANFGYICMNLNQEGQARSVGERLARMRVHPRDAQVNDQYQLDLVRHLRFREQIETAGATIPTHPPAARPAPVQTSHLKFSLPNHYASLGQTVMGLSLQGKDAEAIPLVETALAKAKYDFDRKALRTLLERLKARSLKPATP
jgi:tetratricopeptide (TPR) repeat protein